MKAKLLVAAFLTILLCLPCEGQTKRRVRGTPMRYEVINGDTVFVDVLDPIWVFPKGRKMKSGDWRREYRLVYNFNKVYPYALVGRRMMAQVDSTIVADVTKRSQRNQYITDVEKELFRIFEKDLRNMTVTQGGILMRLVDRECGMPPYDIIKTYINGFAAGFWQAVARLFGSDLKKRYDPSQGQDAKIERLIEIWDSGAWDSFYYSIFWERPPKVILKAETLDSEVRKK